jgi:hypothetical protein
VLTLASPHPYAICELEIALTSQKITKPPAKLLPVSKRVEFNPQDVGFTLATDEETLREIEEIRDKAVKAAQEIRKFAWR